MAERYQADKARNIIGGGWLLYILPLPLIPALFISLLRGDFGQSVAVVSSILLFLGGAILTRKGLAKERDYHQRKIAKAPRPRLKFMGAILVTAGAAFCALFTIGHGLFMAILIALLALAGFYLAYGFDPIQDKVAKASGSGYTTEEVVEAIKEAEEKIAAIKGTAKQLSNPELKQRLFKIAELAGKIIGVIEDDPRDLRRARKFLNTYLSGAQKVSTGYAKTHAKTQSVELEANFRNVLTTIEVVFTEQHQKLLENDLLDLDIQIEVLNTQLKHEGVV